mmetsp:Transcript_5791/g.21917  ORF Transcript_5791/g.21917 Transcript_5791/m.21917 type:complete len:209 (+) Transcript_5791:552-1178(+)
MRHFVKLKHLVCAHFLDPPQKRLHARRQVRPHKPPRNVTPVIHPHLRRGSFALFPRAVLGFTARQVTAANRAVPDPVNLKLLPPGKQHGVDRPETAFVVQHNHVPVLRNKHVLPVPVLLAEQQVEHRGFYDLVVLYSPRHPQHPVRGAFAEKSLDRNPRRGFVKLRADGIDLRPAARVRRELGVVLVGSVPPRGKEAPHRLRPRPRRR